MCLAEKSRSCPDTETIAGDDPKNRQTRVYISTNHGEGNRVMTIDPASLVILLIAGGIVYLAKKRGLPTEISYKGLLIRFPDQEQPKLPQAPKMRPKGKGS
jgi:hypothetical protein